MVNYRRRAPPWSQDAHALGQPTLTPLDILGFGSRIDGPMTIGLAKVERRIREYRIDEIGFEARQVIEAIAFEKHTVLSDVARL